MPRRRRLTEEQQRELTLRQGELTALAQHPSWPVLEAEIEKRVRTFEREITAFVMGNPFGLPLERQHFIRGFIKGMRYVLAVPAGAEESLNKYLREHREEVVSGQQ
jgi:hypothetical protein